jgi:hypothetical protein
MPAPAADETAIGDGHHFAKVFAFDAIRAANRVHCRPLGGRTYSRLNDLEGQRILPQRGALENPMASTEGLEPLIW